MSAIRPRRVVQHRGPARSVERLEGRTLMSASLTVSNYSFETVGTPSRVISG